MRETRPGYINLEVICTVKLMFSRENLDKEEDPGQNWGTPMVSERGIDENQQRILK